MSREKSLFLIVAGVSIVWLMSGGNTLAEDAARAPDSRASQPTRLKTIRSPQHSSAGFIIGADISWVQQQENRGRRFSDDSAEKDILSILKLHGFNYIRLRIFHNPRAPKGYSKEGYCDLEHTLLMARRIKAAGMGFLLDFHYSDTWADPGKQHKPQAWKGLSFDELVKAVHDYTKNVMAALNEQSTPPQMVQIGNEINHGFIWPDGSTKNWDKFAVLLKAGIQAVKEANPTAKIMLHIACGGQNAESRDFLDNVLRRGVEFDMIGESYYPRWHGTLEDLRNNLNDLATRYKKTIVVVEYSAPNVRQINDIVRGVPNEKGIGTFIWEPTSGALFDRKGNTKPDIDAYVEMAKHYARL